MTIQLRPYQDDLVNAIFNQWKYVKDVLAVSVTGSGKTLTFSYIARHMATQGKRVLIQVHRKELVTQISLSLARMGVVHTFVASKDTISLCRKLHQEKLGRVFYSMTANVCVASTGTLVRRNVENWAPGIDYQVLDEAHHGLLDNSWGKVWGKFHNAHGLGVTATPCRGDGYGLGRHADGLFDVMVLGPTMRELIHDGFLCDYRVACPPSEIDFTKLVTGSGGEFTHASIEEAMKNFQCSNVVDQYENRLLGKRAIVFGKSVETCKEIEASFLQRGIPAKQLSAQDTNADRAAANDAFESGRIPVLINCDLFSEGYDVPACEGVIDAQPTKSLSRFHQKVGRALRPAPGKEYAWYIDLVCNVRVDGRGNHALPDAPQLWSLDRRKRSSREVDDNVESLTNCAQCFEPYSSEITQCPHCGYVKPVRGGGVASELAVVDQDLIELSPGQLAELRGEVVAARMDSTEWMRDKFGTNPVGIIPLKHRKDHRNRKEMLLTLDDTIAQWAGNLREFGMADHDIYSAFRSQFGMTIMQARALKRAEAEKLNDKLVKVL